MLVNIYFIQIKSIWKLRPLYSNNSMKQNILMALCSYELFDTDQIPNCWSQQKIDLSRLLERCHIQKNIKCSDLISKGNTFIWYPGNKCTETIQKYNFRTKTYLPYFYSLKVSLENNSWLLFFLKEGFIHFTRSAWE